MNCTKPPKFIMLKDGTLSSIGHKAQKQLKKQKAENKAGN